MIITISGKPGSGKSTVAKILAKKLNLKSYYIGAIRRKLAKEKGMTLEEFNKLGETDKTTDSVVDDYQKKLGEKQDNFVIQGRTSFFFIPDSIKIYLTVDPSEGAKRVFKDLKGAKAKQRNEAKSINTLTDMKNSLKKRESSDIKRYKKYYNLDITDKKHYDLIIDTTNLTIQQVLNKILKYLKKWQN